MKKVFCILSICLVLAMISCESKVRDPLEDTLQFSGDNRSELEYVLKYYSEINPNQQKYRAAEFLISNMRYHTSSFLLSYVPNRYLDSLAHVADSILFANVNSICEDSIYSESFKIKLSDIQESFKEQNKNLFEQNKIELNLKEQHDCQMLPASKIISHIEYAFLSVDSVKLKDENFFNTFCEYILPYKIFSGYPMVDSIQNFSKLFDKYFARIPSDSIIQIVKKYNFIANGLRDFFPTYPHGEQFGISALFYRGEYDYRCILVGHLAASFLRSKGIPAVAELYSAHKLYRGRHSYITIPDERDPLSFDPERSLPKESYKNQIQVANGTTLNIYRLMYSEQKDTPFFNSAKEEYIPKFFNDPFLRDITNNYLKTKSITLPFIENTENKFAYLASFSSEFNEGLTPVTWGEIDKKNKSVIFSTVVTNRLYFPIFYTNKGEIKTFGEPFYLEEDGELNYILYNKTKTNIPKIIITRKFPLKKHIAEISKELKGTIIWGSNDPSFKKANIIGQIDKELIPYYQDIFLNTDLGPYKYYRIKASERYPYIKLSEIQLLTNIKYNYSNTLAPSKLPILFPDENISLHNRDSTLIRILDIDIESAKKLKYSDNNPTTALNVEQYIDFKFAKPKHIERLRIMPLNSNNGINAGDYYQLFEWNNGKWELIESQQAKFNYLLSDRLYLNGLFYLKNRTKGQEELPFMITKSGEQKFIYQVE